MSENWQTAHRKFTLQSGEPCRKHRCTQCCIGTQMSLTHQDIHRIIKAGYQPSAFIIHKEGEWRLANQQERGHCVFLNDNKCQIYEDRPTGCRIYPLVFNETWKLAVIDSLCPFSNEFQITDMDRENLFALIKQLDNESEQKAYTVYRETEN
jgi:Fe-S-cluster containining protein